MKSMRLLDNTKTHNKNNTITKTHSNNLFSNSDKNLKYKIANLPTNVKSINNNSNSNYLGSDNYEKDEKYAQEKIIAKVIKKGFESLTLEEVAVTLISPNFEEEYYQKTSQEWSKDYKAKAKERLNNAKFNIQWNTQVSKTMQVPFGVLFELVEKGDIQRVTEYYRKNAQYNEALLNAVDKNKRSPLHLSAKNGNTNLTNMLLSRGYSVHMRDKFLRTPLHSASQYGCATVADILIKNNSDITAKDSVGRSCLHLAACSNSVELVSLLLGVEPDLVYTKDIYGRTALHYVLWNINPNSIEISRLLIKSNSEIDALDDEGMTPLHYASDGGKGWIIPLLLRNGANPFLRDGRTHRNALELALTEHVREMMIVYSGKPYVVKSEDMELMKLTGEKLDVEVLKNEESRGRQKSQPGRRINRPKIEEKKFCDDEMNNCDINTFLFKSQKEKVMNFLKRIQEYGIKSMQHMNKPHLYSGSWIENIKNIQDFFNDLNSSTPAESVIKVFNILFPYSQLIPPVDGEESDMAQFFNNFNQNKNHHNNFVESNNQYQNSNSVNEIEFLKEKLKNLEDLYRDSKINDNSPDNTAQLKNQIIKYETENQILKSNAEKLTQTIEKLSENLSNYKKLLEESKNSEESIRKESDKLKMRIKELEEENGKFFLEKEKNNILQNINLNELKMFNKFNQVFRKDCDNVSLTLSEEKSVYAFLQRAENIYGGLSTLLSKFDKDNDLHIFKNEMINLLEEIDLPMEDRPVVLNLSGFNSTTKKMPVKNILDNFYKREENKNKNLNEILFRISYFIHNKFIPIESLYEFLKLNEENKLSLSELKQGMNSLEIGLSDNEIEGLFRALLYGHDDRIRLVDFIDKLKIRKAILDEIGDLDNKIRSSDDTFVKNEQLEEINILEKQTEYKEKENLNEEMKNPQEIYSEPNSITYEYSDNINLNYSKDNKKSLPLEENSKLKKEKDDKIFINTYQHTSTVDDIQKIATLNLSHKMKKNDNISENKNFQNFSNKSKKNVYLDKKINGEIKIQIKNVENIILPSSINRPYSFVITGSLKGIDMKFNSREINSDSIKSITFNWATRIMIRNQTLTDLGSLLKLELKLINKKIPLLIGECLFNWTVTLQEENLDVFVIDDRFQLLSKRMTSTGMINVQVKFIPFGSKNSHYDKDGKKKIVPNTLRSLIEKEDNSEKNSIQNGDAKELVEDQNIKTNRNQEETLDMKDIEKINIKSVDAEVY